MSVQDGSRSVQLPWVRLRAIALAGAAVSVLVFATGWVSTRIALGVGTTAARERIEAGVRATIDEAARGLRGTAVPFEQGDVVERADQGDMDAVRSLFERAAAVAGDDEGTQAVTIYGAAGQAIAWAGRPSDIPTAQLAGDEGWSLVQGALGLRLVYVRPVPRSDGRRVGAVSTEKAIDVVPSTAGEGSDFVMVSAATPVAIVLTGQDATAAAAPGQFDVLDPAGHRLLQATVTEGDLVQTERRWRRASVSAALLVGSATLFLLCGPLLAWQRRADTLRMRALGLTGCALAVVAGRGFLRIASPADYASADLFSGSTYASALAAPLLTSPFDFLVTALSGAALLLLIATLVEAARVDRLTRRVPVTTSVRYVSYLAIHLLAGTITLQILLWHRTFVSDTIANTVLDLLQFSLHPWNAARLAIQVGLVVWHVMAIGSAALVLRAATLPWRLPRRLRPWLATGVIWMTPWLVWVVVTRGATPSGVPLLAGVLTATLLASVAPRLSPRYRHGSQAFRLVLLSLMVVIPALSCYPVVFAQVSVAKRYLVETRYASQAINQRQTIQRLLQSSLAQIDQLPSLPDLVQPIPAVDDSDASTERAFGIWRATGLADYPVTSSVELFGRDGRLVSRFAFNLPDDLTTTPRADEEQCAWTIYEEVSPFFAEERRVLHAGRGICEPGGVDSPSQVVGTIVVHAILDYANLPFIASQSPYVELLRPGDESGDESLLGRDLEYAVYGWSGRPFYASGGTAWQLPPDTLGRLAESRAAVWTTLQREDTRYGVYVLNDRGGIYALGFPLLSTLGHLVNLAEVTVLASVTCVLLLFFTVTLDAAGGERASGRALLREIRASFYRKLFLAFVAASVVPVVALALLTRNYIADQLRTGVEQEAVRTVAAARRVVEDLVIPRSAATRETVDDNLMVWVSRLIDQDVNIFRGARLQATSERNLFASGILATRTPADVYRALILGRDATAIISDRVGSMAYLVAATPLTTRQFDGMLTVPLTLRQRDIENQIDTLNRLVLLGALLFILGGAGIGYSMAERIADPVNRLSRATRRIAHGEFDLRMAATSSDELGRLVHDFNRMAGDLQNQRAELERTHRLEAWAEMARQVAHEIKNPLTPIQLNAEHLRRVHADRGRPLSPVLDECVANILTQVSLLRAIASEFSSFASAPVVHRAATALAPLVQGIMAPYEGALQGKVAFSVDVPAGLPDVMVDRTLLTRAFTNLIENSLHAMPTGGLLSVVARGVGDDVDLRVSDTGVGMDAAALARAFEPYFSTKVTGTGLGLPIAKRNVELTGGTIEIESILNKGTSVALRLPTS